MKLILSILASFALGSEFPGTSEVDINKEWLNELTDGDIKGPTRGNFKFGTKSAIRNKFVRWKHDVNYVPIPFEFGSEMPIITRGISKDAMRNYALRTCIDLKPWEGEEQYIQIHSYGGCWSYVGWSYYSGQDLSIGSGCNSQTGTFQHEFMHALGIFHEQSRPDRDDYVSINLTYVNEGARNNFAKYSFDEVSIEDVPYDYESVMHYGATGFVNPPGTTSIDPKIPYFANVIGQRKDFSRNDVQKINYMYNCSEPLLNSFSCDFNEVNLCGFVNEPIDDKEQADKLQRIEWRQFDATTKELVGDISYIGKGGEINTDRELLFPISDHSDGRDDLGRFMTLNGSYYLGDDNTNREGVLQSRQFRTKAPQQCLEIWSNIHSDSAEIIVEIWESSDQYGEVVGRYPVHQFTIKNDIDGIWQINRWTINAPDRFKLIIRSTLQSNDDVIVIDDVSILDRACESHYWAINNFQQIYESTPYGQFIESPKMTASTGHIFVLRFYPKGHPNQPEGKYLSLFLHLHSDSNGLDLEYPWVNQFLKYIVQDQISDAVNRMDQNRVRATELDPENPAKWGIVTDPDETGASISDSVIGYETFIPSFDVFEASYSYIKHDMLMILLDVRDMRDEDTSSKLDLCAPEGAPPCAGEGKTCLPKKDNPYQYACTCHYPFEEVWDGDEFSCICPAGYEYNADAENMEIERLTCFSLCDFPESNPCLEDQTCIQKSTGVTCVDIVEQPDWNPVDPKPTPTAKPSLMVQDDVQGEYSEGDQFDTGDLGLAIVVTFLSTAFLFALLALFFHSKKNKIIVIQQPVQMAEVPTMSSRIHREDHTYQAKEL